jgi:hypothetical protein
MDPSAEITPPPCNNQPTKIQPATISQSQSSAAAASQQAATYAAKDTPPVAFSGGSYKKKSSTINRIIREKEQINYKYKEYYEILFKNKSYTIYSHSEKDAIHIFLKNKIYKRDYILQIKKIESMRDVKKNIIVKDKNYSLYIIRGFKKNVFDKI